MKIIKIKLEQNKLVELRCFLRRNELVELILSVVKKENEIKLEQNKNKDFFIRKNELVALGLFNKKKEKHIKTKAKPKQ